MQAPVRPKIRNNAPTRRVGNLYPPVAVAGRAIFLQEPKHVLVRVPRNTARKAPRKPVFVPPFQVDHRGAELRQAMSIARMVAKGVLEAPQKTPKGKPEISRRQVRQEFIRNGQLDAEDLAEGRRERRRTLRDTRKVLFVDDAGHVVGMILHNGVRVGKVSHLTVAEDVQQ